MIRQLSPFIAFSAMMFTVSTTNAQNPSCDQQLTQCHVRQANQALLAANHPSTHVTS